MRPLFKRLSVKFRLLQDSHDSDCESSNFLEMPATGSTIRNSQRKTPYQGFNHINYTHAAVAPARVDFKGLDSKTKRPPNRILVETDLEQSVHS